MDSIYTEELLNQLKSLTNYFNESASHYIIRCPYCGDSRKRSDTGHLYISKDNPVFRCNRCSYGSRLDKLISDVIGKKIKIKDIVNENVKLDNLLKYEYSDSLALKKSKPIEYKRMFEYDYKRIYANKYYYLKNRLNFEIEKDTMLASKIVLNIKETIYENKMLYNKLLKMKDNDQLKTEKFINYLERNFVGISTYNNNTIILRNINIGDDFRYYKLTSNEKIRDYFLIDNLIEHFEEVPKIIVAEGPFDVIIPYIKFSYNQELSNFFKSSLYLACGSKGFIKAINFVAVQKTIPQFDIVLLSDNSEDINMRFYNYIYKKLKKFIKSLIVLNNTEGKDFGINDIKPCITKIY